ncbi:alpha/beta hydrolase [Haloferula sp. BvORR071]|uniref:alpha/beta hydrolase n=1 Tax=Haloferula sp. BvORR071 TaxID=1396141 RepID=UPI0006981E31|nr:alpha/beta hydrolase [Haloferula sp. BvORR071]
MRPLLILLGLVCLPVVAAEEKRLVDVEYAKAGDVSLRLDAVVPEGDGPFPIAILIHGGGWGSGDKAQDFGALEGPLAKSGIAWFSINYRLAPEHRWPACIEDVQAAICWVKAHAAEYRCDPKRVALVGYSAGGQLAALAAIRAEGEARVQAVVGLAPAVELVEDTKRRGPVVGPAMRNLLDLPEAMDEAALKKIATISPAEEVRAGLPPFLLVQGTADKSVRHLDTLAFAERLKKVEVACEVFEMKDAQHRIADWGKFSPEYGEKVAEWLKGVWGKQ